MNDIESDKTIYSIKNVTAVPDTTVCQKCFDLFQNSYSWCGSIVSPIYSRRY